MTRYKRKPSRWSVRSAREKIAEALDPQKASGKCISLGEMSEEKRAEMRRLYERNRA